MSQNTNDSAAAAPVTAPTDAHVDMSDLGMFETAGDDVVALEDRVPPRRLLRAEAILARRTSRALLVLETMADENNHQALLRTADSFGIQHVWVVRSGVERKHRLARKPTKLQAAMAESVEEEQHIIDNTGSISMAAGRWLSLRYFDCTADCIAALREDNRSIWVTTLRAGARVMDRSFPSLDVPSKVAIVLGREIDGVSPEMCAAADMAIFLPMVGFSESFNVSVAGALVIQRIMDLIPESIGDLDEEQKNQLRAVWYTHLSASTPALQDEYLKYWLPHAKEIETHMRKIQQEEFAAATAATSPPAAAAASSSSSSSSSSASPASATAAAADAGLSLSSLLRPLEELRIPKVQRKVRMRMEKEGQRVICLPPDASPTSDNPVAATVRKETNASEQK